MTVSLSTPELPTAEQIATARAEIMAAFCDCQGTLMEKYAALDGRSLHFRCSIVLPVRTLQEILREAIPDSYNAFDSGITLDAIAEKCGEGCLCVMGRNYSPEMRIYAHDLTAWDCDALADATDADECFQEQDGSLYLWWD
jgi:hypothetical protein